MEFQEGRGVRNALRRTDTDETAERPAVVDRLFGQFVGQVVAALDDKHAFDAYGLAPDFTGFRVMGLDYGDPLRPRHEALRAKGVLMVYVSTFCVLSPVCSVKSVFP